MALSKLKFLSYNNYNSRDAEKKTTFANYNATASDITYCCDYWIGVGQTGYNGGIGALVSFNPGDGVNTYGIEAVDWVNDWEPNYLVVATENNVIESRWFVMDFSRTKLNQFKMTLRRDVIVDNFDQIKRAEIFIEKATLPDSNPLIFNSENFAVNQIKTSELLLKDRTNCAWLVGFLDRKYTNPENTTFSQVEIQHEFDNPHSFPYDTCVRYPTGAKQPTTVLKLVHDQMKWQVNFTDNGESKTYNYIYDTIENRIMSTDDPQVQQYNRYILVNSLSIENAINDTRRSNSDFADYVYLSDDTSDFISYNGSTLYFANGVSDPDLAAGVYQLKYTQTGTTMKYALSQELRNLLFDIFVRTPVENRQFQALIILAKPITTYTRGIGYTEYRLIDTPAFELPAFSLTRPHLHEQPWDMFAIPVLDGTITNSAVGSFGTINSTKENALMIAQALATKLGGTDGFLYDLQILPYSPVDSVRGTSGGINLNTAADNYTVISTGNTKKTVMLWCSYSTGTKTIDVNIDYLNKKLDSQTNFIRIVSPNFNGQYEFNHVKNDELNQVQIYYTYLPYNSFIQVNPVLNATGIYRQGSPAFDDARGLCVQGDFSVSIINNEWKNYQIQNKNFQNIFDRQIQSMDFKNNLQKQQEIDKLALGGLNMVATTAGNLATGNYIGATASATAGLGNTILNIRQNQRNEAIRQETLDFTRDQFGYQLGNLIAMPQSIGKTTAINAINKIFPMIETYTCTLEEKKALANKIRHNGMTVMTIGKITDFYANSWSWSYTEDGTTHTITARNYFKGKLIKIPDFVGDNHMLEAIAEELDKGIYIKGSMIS